MAQSSMRISVQETSSSMTTTAGEILSQRRRERLENGKELLRKLLGYADEDDVGNLLQGWFEERGVEDVEDDEEDHENDIDPSGSDATPSSVKSVRLRKADGKKMMTDPL